MSQVIVRYAPSPTGVPHIGNLRTALFNFLFAKNQNGKFILRIEDTDQKRFIAESVSKIKESLSILNLTWDEIYVQSKRLKLYHRHLKILKDKSYIYEEEGAWRFRVPKELKLKWNDLVHGPVEFSSNVIEDFIIVKSDGFPTYHFASVVDDHEIKISHVIRGDEWIPSTPKHLLLYKVFAWPLPKFIHLPPILGPEKKKLSKRGGAKSVLEYIDEGYLPEAIINFLALLGWAPKGDEEVFSLDELIKEFSLERLNKNSPIFNLQKLNWLNGQWIRKIPEENLVLRISNLYQNLDKEQITRLVPLVHERMQTLADFPKLTRFFFEPPSPITIPMVPVSNATISHILVAFKNSRRWASSSIKEIIDQVSKEDKVERVDTIAGIRNIISGSKVTPPLYESLEKLGKEETLRRLDGYLKKAKE